MTYLDLYSGNPESRSIPHEYRPIPSMNLDLELREGLGLPRLGQVGLNRAWPLVQGCPGSAIQAYQCANEECGKSTKGAVPGAVRSRFLVPLHRNDPLGLRYCKPCVNHYEKEGDLPTRQGIPNGRLHENRHSAVNKKWFSDGNPRKCYNCEVHIPEDAFLYGYARGIRCFRCDQYRRSNFKEWNEDTSPDSDKDGIPCSICQSRCYIPHSYQWGSETLCSNCNQARCCYNPRRKVKGSSDTLGRCSNPSCQSNLPGNPAFYRFVEDIRQNVWRCLICDWAWSLFGLEVPEGLEKDFDLDTAPEPIAHHRYNATSCYTCGRYATPQTWTPTDGANFNCDICLGYRKLPDIYKSLGIAKDVCGNPTCENDSNNYSGPFRTLNDESEIRCIICFQYLQKGKGERNVFPKLKRVCGNLACDRTNDNWHGEFLTISSGRDASLRDLSLIRCRTCYAYYNRHGIDRNPRPEQPSFKQCGNPNCNMDSNNYTGQWHFLPGHQYEEPYRRCSACETHLRKKGWTAKERIPQVSLPKPDYRVCGNPNCTENTTTHSGRWYFIKGHSGDEAFVRCSRCYAYSRSHGDAERVPGPPKSARSCKNPHCNANATNYQRRWSFLPGHRGDEEYLRCDSCIQYWKAHDGADRIPK